MTDYQRYWYLKGYLESFIHNVSINMNIEEKTVREWLINSLIVSCKIDITR